MKITREADYAVRIVYVLMQAQRVMPASEISEHTGVTLRFALKNSAQNWPAPARCLSKGRVRRLSAAL